MNDTERNLLEETLTALAKNHSLITGAFRLAQEGKISPRVAVDFRDEVMRDLLPLIPEER